MIPTPTTCPVLNAERLPSDADLEPLLEMLGRDDLPDGDARLPWGTVCADGRLDLCKQNLGAHGSARVLRALHAQTRIDAVLLGTNAIGDAGALEVARAIGRGRLETVYLGCNGIGPVGAEAISTALESDVRVRALWLKRNPLGGVGVRRIARMLERNRTLRTLDLVNTDCDHDAMLELLGVVATHESLEHLYLSGNGLDASEAAAVAACLRRSRCLKSLYLSVNHLGDDGARRIAEALGDSSSLERLSLASNGLGDEGVSALCAALETTSAVRALDLGYSPSTKVLGARGNRIGSGSVPAVRSLLERGGRELNLHPNAFTATERRSLRDIADAHPTPERLILEAGDAGVRGEPPHHDAERIRSVYR
jgi:Ran GTPase-activating protein (RanGAP) involved in mRNA processing and transport